MANTKPDMNQKHKIAIPVTTYTFEAILQYVISYKNINTRFLRNIMKFIDMLDWQTYEKDKYVTMMLSAIQMVTGLRYDGVSNLTYIKNTLAQSDLNQNQLTSFYQRSEALSKNEYDNLSSIIENYVAYSYLYQARPDIIAAFDNLVMTQNGVSKDTIEQLQTSLEMVLSNIRRADASRSETEGVSLSSKPSKELRNELSKLYDELTDPSNIFKTGLKELNRFLNGGVRRKGMVIVYGPTNSFKSGVLLYFALWIIQFNPGLKPKVPGKKLGVVLVTMENTREETLERIYAIYTQGLSDVQHITKETWLEQWETIFPSFGNDVEFHVIYRNPVDTTSIDIQAVVEELEEDRNLEIMAVIIDHLGNIKARSKASTVNEWRDTVQIAYELSSWAKDSDRALITAMHTNSTIDDRIAEAVQAGKTNIVRMLGRHAIADAKYIDRVVDLSLYIFKEYSHLDGYWYLGWKNEKVRKKRDKGSNVFYHRLENDITLMYDEGTQICRSFPCIPGTENTIQMQQMATTQQAVPLSQGLFQHQSSSPFAHKVNTLPPAAPVINNPSMTNYEPAEIAEEFVSDSFTDNDFNEYEEDDLVQLQENPEGVNTEEVSIDDINFEIVNDDVGDEIARTMIEDDALLTNT